MLKDLLYKSEEEKQTEEFIRNLIGGQKQAADTPDLGELKGDLAHYSQYFGFFNLS